MKLAFCATCGVVMSWGND